MFHLSTSLQVRTYNRRRPTWAPVPPILARSAGEPVPAGASGPAGRSHGHLDAGERHQPVGPDLQVDPRESGRPVGAVLAVGRSGSAGGRIGRRRDVDCGRTAEEQGGR